MKHCLVQRWFKDGKRSGYGCDGLTIPIPLTQQYSSAQGEMQRALETQWWTLYMEYLLLVLDRLE